AALLASWPTMTPAAGTGSPVLEVRGHIHRRGRPPSADRPAALPVGYTVPAKLASQTFRATRSPTHRTVRPTRGPPRQSINHILAAVNRPQPRVPAAQRIAVDLPGPAQHTSDTHRTRAPPSRIRQLAAAARRMCARWPAHWPAVPLPIRRLRFGLPARHGRQTTPTRLTARASGCPTASAPDRCGGLLPCPTDESTSLPVRRRRWAPDPQSPS